MWAALPFGEAKKGAELSGKNGVGLLAQQLFQPTAPRRNRHPEAPWIA
jgi:hypothetical protein